MPKFVEGLAIVRNCPRCCANAERSFAIQGRVIVQHASTMKVEAGTEIALLLPVQTDSIERSRIMKGYMTAEGYMGYVGGRYILFVSESEYLDYMEEKEAA